MSKKHGSAVRRNRIKRILREFFRLARPGLTLALDIVAVPKSSLDPAALDLASVRNELAPLLARAERDAARARDQRQGP